MKKSENSTITNLHHLLDYEIRHFSGTENQLKNPIKKWTTIASSLNLKTVLQHYLSIVEEHLSQLESYTLAEQMPAVTVSSRVMKALIEDTEDKMKDCQDKEVSDACLLASVQQINHIKISLYGTAAAFARELGNEKAASLFHLFEINEKKIDQQLTRLARKEINPRALVSVVLARP